MADQQQQQQQPPNNGAAGDGLPGGAPPHPPPPPPPADPIAAAMQQIAQAIVALSAGQQQLQQQFLQQKTPEGVEAPPEQRDPGVAVSLEHPYAPVGANPADFEPGGERELFSFLDYSNNIEFSSELNRLRPDGTYALPAQREETIAFLSLGFYSTPILGALRALSEYVSDDGGPPDAEQLREAVQLITSSFAAIDAFLQERAAYLRLKARNMHNAQDTYSVPLAHRKMLENVRAAPSLGSTQLQANLTRQSRAANQQLDKIVAKELAQQLAEVLRSERGRRDEGESSRTGAQRSGRKGGRGEGSDRPGTSGKGGRGSRGGGSNGSSGGGAPAPAPRS